MKLVTSTALAIVVLAGPAAAQWAKVPDRAVSQAADGSFDLTARAPRRDGRTDLSGIWIVDADFTPPVPTIEHSTFPRHMLDITADLEPETVPFQPWAAELFQQRLQSGGIDSPIAHCKPTGMPWINAIVLPFKIVQADELILILYEENTVFRQIFLDGRKPVEDPVPRWMGYSTGRWDGDTLVVDTVGLTDQSWLDGMGHPHTDRLHVIERFRRTDAGHLTIEMTIEDPGAYTRPIVYAPTYTLVPDDELLEYFCTENEKDVERYR